MIRNRKKLSELALLVLISGIWFTIGWLGRGYRLGQEIGLIEQVRQGLRENYPFEMTSSRELTYAAIRGMLARVGDPHAALLEPEVGQRFDDDFSGVAGVVGMIAAERNGQIVVTTVIPGEPAEQAGLRPGDVLLSVDGVEFDRFTTEAEASLLIRGPVGEPAHFVVRRGDQVLQFDPLRETRLIATGEMLDGGIAYLAHYRFSTNAPEKVKTILVDLLAQNPKGLIWDLRGNGGGSMDAAQQVLSYFVQEGLLFKAEMKSGEQREYLALQGQGIAAGLPLVVLIGENTYSSAETAAAAIHDLGRGTLVGGATHGKGTIQTTVPLLDGSLLQFTIAKWLSPTGEWFEGRGVAPDISSADDPDTPADEVLQRGIDLLLQK